MRRFLTVLGIALVALGLGRGAGTAQAATLVVCKHGCPYSSINAAIDAAAPADTILIKKGVYGERVDIDIDVALLGEDRHNTTIKSTIFVHQGVSANINALGVDSGGVGIVNNGVLVAVNVEVSGGRAVAVSGGIDNEGNLTLINSTVRNNQTGGFGGGIYNANGARLTLQASTVRNNRASSGGGIYNAAARDHVRLEQGSSVTNNQPDNCVNVTGC